MEALDRAGLVAKKASWSDLAPLDQFHVRGLPACEELAVGMGLKAGDTVLDIGCGLGGPSRYLAATFGCNVTGLDLNEHFVELARALAEFVDLQDLVTYVQGDALHLDFADSSFDHAWTQHVAMNIADRRRLYSDIRRVLRSGGRFGIYDVVRGENEPVVYPLPWARRAEDSFLVSPDEMRELLVSAGFREVAWRDVTDLGLHWFQKLQQTPPSRSTFGLSLVMGEDFPMMSANLFKNLKNDRVRLVQAVMEAA